MLGFRKIALFACLAASIAIPAAMSQSLAADLGGTQGGSYKDSHQEPQPGFSWTGVYVGGHAGIMTGNTQGGVEAFGPFISALTATDYNMDGGTYGVHAGYNYQMGNAVIGIEGDYSAADVQGNSACIVLLNCQRELDWTASLVGRLGYAAGRSLFYAKGGVVWGDLDTSVGIAGLNLLSGGETHTGWVVGMGVEHALTDNLIFRIDYSHMDFGSQTHNLDFTPAPGFITVPTEVEAKFDTIKLGVSYKF